MKITNNYGLPDPIVRAIQRDTYTRGRAQISVTELMDSPRIRLLKNQHGANLEVDASDQIWTLLGRAIHLLLEQMAKSEFDAAEHRFFLKTDVGGWVLSGGVDLYTSGDELVITDYKFTTARQVMYPKAQWEQQLNVYRYLLYKSKGLLADRLQICAIVRDYMKAKSTRHDHPDKPIVLVDIPTWNEDRCEAWISERMKLHFTAERGWFFSDEMPPCTDDERWMRTATYGVYKVGGKRVVKNGAFKSHDEAHAFLAEKVRGEEGKKKPDQFEIRTKPAEPVRCVSYCPVSDYCSQWQAEKHLYEVKDDDTEETD